MSKMPEVAPARDERAYWLCVALAFIALVSPIVFERYAPLVDFPNHLARGVILARYDSVAEFQRDFAIQWAPIPNVAIDVVLTFLVRFMSIVSAGKVFLVALVGVYVASVIALSRVLWRRNSWVTIPCLLFVYNSAFLYGFVNYVFGIALAQLSLAAWLNWRAKWSGVRAAIMTLLIVATYLSHLAAFVVLGVACVAVSLADLIQRKETVARLLGGGLPLVPPLFLHRLFMQSGGQVGTLRWETGSAKLVGLLTVIRTYYWRFDIVLVLATLVLCVWVGMNYRRLTISPALWAAAALFLAFALSPVEAFTGSAVDQRFLPPAFLLLVLGVRFDSPRPLARVILAGVVLFSAVRLGAIWTTWATLNREIAAAVPLTDSLPTGSRVYPLYERPAGSDAAKQDQPHEHVLMYSVESQHLFVPTLFAIRGQQPLVFRTTPVCPGCGLQLSPTVHSAAALRSSWRTELRGYDYLWLHSASPEAAQLAAECCRLIQRSGRTSVWAIQH
jgi:hypothetical protein